MSDLSPQEMSVQGSAMVTYLHAKLAAAMAEIAELHGKNAVLEYKLAKATGSQDAPK